MTHESFNVPHIRKPSNEDLTLGERKSICTELREKIRTYFQRLDLELDLCVLIFELDVFYFFLKLCQVMIGELSAS